MIYYEDDTDIRTHSKLLVHRATGILIFNYGTWLKSVSSCQCAFHIYRVSIFPYIFLVERRQRWNRRKVFIASTCPSPCYTPPSSSIYLSPAPKKQKQKKFSPFTNCPSISHTTQIWQSLFTIYKLHFWIWRSLAIHTHITDLFIELQRVPVSPGCFPLGSSQHSNQHSSKSPSPKTCRSSIGQQYSFNSTRRLGSSRH